MVYYFNGNDIENGLNIVEFDDLVFTAQYVSGESEVYRAIGSAVIDGELFTIFEIEFIIAAEPSNLTASEILASDWEEYDYIFPVQ